MSANQTKHSSSENSLLCSTYREVFLYHREVYESNHNPGKEGEHRDAYNKGDEVAADLVCKLLNGSLGGPERESEIEKKEGCSLVVQAYSLMLSACT